MKPLCPKTTLLLLSLIVLQLSNAQKPNLFFDQARIDEVIAAVAIPGTHHARAYNAMKNRVDQNDWMVYDINPDDNNYSYARSWLAREASLMYAITGNTFYSDIAYQQLQDIINNPDPDNRTLTTNSGLARAMIGLGFSITYDWCYDAFTQVQRDWIKGEIQNSLNVWPSFNHGNLSHPHNSNWNAVCRGSELVQMLAINEQGIRASRFDTLKILLDSHLTNGYDDHGWSNEGVGYVEYAGTFLLPAIFALESTGDNSLRDVLDTISFWRLPMQAWSYIPITRGDMNEVLRTGVDYSPPLSAEGWESLLLNTVPASEMPYYMHSYNLSKGINSNLLSDEHRFDRLRAGTTWSLIFYPESITPIDPTGQLSTTYFDDEKGSYYYRNRWQDQDDIMACVIGDYHFTNRGHNRAESFNIALNAYGTTFFGGPGNVGAYENYSGLLVNNDAVDNRRDTGAQTDFSEETTNGGYVIIDGGQKYEKLGLTSSKRHYKLEFNDSFDDIGVIIATLDQLNAAQLTTYNWQLNTGDSEGDDGIVTTTGIENGKNYFLFTAPNGSYVKGWLINRAADNVVTGDPLRLDIVDTDANIFVAMIAGKQNTTPPVATFQGSGLATVITIANKEISYNSNTNRIEFNENTLSNENLQSGIAQLSYYPNPVDNSLIIESNSKIISTEVYNIIGQKLKDKNNLNVSKLSIDMTSFYTGTYFIRVKTEEKTSTFKVLKN